MKRDSVVRLGFGLWVLLCAATGATDEEASPPPPPRPAVRVYTNEDLDRVHELRDQTGVRSVPAEAPAAPAPLEEPLARPTGRGESYWRREAARARERVLSLEAQAGELRARIAERAEEAGRALTRRRRSSSGGSDATIRAKLAGIERRIRQEEEDLSERARRDGALPGWLR